MYKRILIATDGTRLASKAVRAGIKLAATLNAEVFAFMAVERYPHSFFDSVSEPSLQYIEEINSQLKKRAQVVLNRVKEIGKFDGVEITAVTGFEPVGAAILKCAAKHDCDLIIMASHGRKGIKRLILGSETQDVLTHSTIPVLVLR
jgi:nucleotide-binding universal stress UspA family protein